MNGKNKCKILKDIRRQIAQDNDIEYVTSECKYQGDCSGTCPKCEAELRNLEQELYKRQKAGKAIALAGITAALVVGSSGCALDNLLDTVTPGKSPNPNTTQTTSTYPERTEPSIEQPMGFLSPPEQTENTIPGEISGVPVIPETSEPELQGEPAVPDPTYEMLPGFIVAPTEEELMGDIPLWP